MNQDISLQTLLSHTPDNLILAAIVLLVLYAVKSATIIIPLILLELAVGHLFPLWTALGINFVDILGILPGMLLATLMVLLNTHIFQFYH